MPHVLDPEPELVYAAQRRTDDAAGCGRCLNADVPVRARPDEQAHLDAVLASDRDHPTYLIVGLQHDAAALAHTMNGDTLLAGRGDHRCHDLRPLAGGNFDAILPAVTKPLPGSTQTVRVAHWKAQVLEDLFGSTLGHSPPPRAAPPLCLRLHVECRPT